MIVLHVARARTDSINIRGSLGKTRAALWITNATFLYFSRCNAHTPFTLFPFLFLSLSFFLISLSSPSRLPSFYGFPLLGRHRILRFSLLSARAMLLVFSSVSSTLSFSPLFLSFTLDPSPPTIPCPFAEQTETRQSPTSPLRIVTLPAEMETALVSYSRLPCSRN